MAKFVKQFRLAILLVAMMFMATSGYAQSHCNRIMVGVGALYERGLDATISLEHETNNHHAWEYFTNGYLKYEDDPAVGHITRDSFWKSYYTWGGGRHSLQALCGKRRWQPGSQQLWFSPSGGDPLVATWTNVSAG